MQITVDYNGAQIFDEVGVLFRMGPFLENMHGKDSKAISSKYAASFKGGYFLNLIVGVLC